MIILDDKIELAASETSETLSSASSATVNTGQLHEDAPPVYTPSDAPSSSLNERAESPPPHAGDTELRPTNMLYLSRENQAIRGTWLIDPALVIPQSVLAPLCCGATRKNIVLKSRNGPILADIRVAPSYGPRPLGQRTTMEFSSHNGPINIKIRRPEGETVSVQVTSWNGSTTIYLPRSFTGPVSTTHSNGSVKCSAALTAQTTLFTENTRTRHSFVGDPTGSGWCRAPDEWTGDELTVDAKNGSIRILYIGDEESFEDGPKKKKDVNISMSFEWADGERAGPVWGRWLPWGRS